MPESPITRCFAAGESASRAIAAASTLRIAGYDAWTELYDAGFMIFTDASPEQVGAAMRKWDIPEATASNGLPEQVL